MIGNGKDHEIIFAQIANKAISNTTNETSMFNNTGARGSRTIKANTLKVGDIIKVKSSGIVGDTGTPTATLKIKMNAVDLISSLVTMTDFGQGLYYDIEFLITVRSIGETGSVCGEGKTFFKAVNSLTAGLSRALQMLTDIVIDTTIDQTFDMTYKWGSASASNNITSRNFTIELT